MKGQIRQLFSLGVIYSIGGLLEKGVHFIFLPVYTYYLNPQEYGIIAMMVLVVNLIYPLFQSAFAAGVQRHYYAPEHRDNQGELVFFGFSAILILAVFSSTLFYIFSRPISALVLDDDSLVPVVKVFAVVLLCEPISQYFLMLFKLQKKAYRFLLVSLSRTVLFAAAVIYLLVVMNLGYMAIAYGSLINCAFVTVFGFCFIARDMKFNFNLSFLRPVMAYGLPLVIPSVSFFLINSSDRFILKIFSPLETVGLFVFASHFPLIFKTLVLVPLKNALSPIVFEHEDDPAGIRGFLFRSASYFCMVSFMIWLLISLFSKELVQVMARDSSYWSTWPIVPIVTLSSVILGFNTYSNKGIVMAKKPSLITFTYLFGCGANVALNFALIPLWGPIGAAIATCLALILFTGLNGYYSYRLYGLIFDLSRIGRIALVAGLLAAFGIGCNAFDLLTAVVLKLFLLTVFPVLLLLTGLVSREEFHAFKEVVLSSKVGRVLGSRRLDSKSMKG